MSDDHTPHCSCLFSSGLSLSNDLHLDTIKHKLLLASFLCILFTSSLEPFTIGVMMGMVLIFYVVGRLLLDLACPKDNIRRVRLVASGDRRCPVLWLMTLGFWNRKVQTKFITMTNNERMVVNIWPLQFGEFSEEKFCKYGTRMTHTAIVEVVGRELKIMYPVNNMDRSYPEELEPQIMIEAFTFHHKITLSKAKVSLTGVNDKNSLSKKFSKKLPICVETLDCCYPHSFYIFPRVKRNKERLYNLLMRAQVEENVERLVENLVEKVTLECKMKFFSERGEDFTIEIINVIINWLGARFLTQEMIFDPIENILKKSVIRYLGRFFKNFGVRHVDPGDKYPLIKMVSKPWYNDRGLWAKVVICETNDKRSITVEANQLNIPATSSNQPCSSDEDESSSFSPLNLIDILDEKIDQLAFTLEIHEFELVLLINIPPPYPSLLTPLRLWVGLCHLPQLNIQLKASGASPRLNSFLNNILPMVKDITIKKMNHTLETDWVFPQMKKFNLPIRPAQL